MVCLHFKFNIKRGLLIVYVVNVMDYFKWLISLSTFAIHVSHFRSLKLLQYLMYCLSFCCLNLNYCFVSNKNRSKPLFMLILEQINKHTRCLNFASINLINCSNSIVRVNILEEKVLLMTLTSKDCKCLTCTLKMSTLCNTLQDIFFLIT